MKVVVRRVTEHVEVREIAFEGEPEAVQATLDAAWTLIQAGENRRARELLEDQVGFGPAWTAFELLSQSNTYVEVTR